MGLAESALILLGIGIVSSRFQAGAGLGELGKGISTLVAAPLVGTGTGLSTFAGGIRDISSTLGDLGRGLGALFENIPQLPPPREGPPRHGTGNGNGNGIIWAATQPLIPDSGGNSKTLLSGGGGNVPQVGVQYVPPPPTPAAPDIAPAPLPTPPSPIPPTGGSSRMRYYVL